MFRAWVSSIAGLQGKAPYNKFVAKINAIISDGVVTAEEAEDLIWLCKNYLDCNWDSYYDVITSSTQQLCGFLVGISADPKSNIEELVAPSEPMSLIKSQVDISLIHHEKVEHEKCPSI